MKNIESQMINFYAVQCFLKELMREGIIHVPNGYNLDTYSVYLIDRFFGLPSDRGDIMILYHLRELSRYIGGVSH